MEDLTKAAAELCHVLHKDRDACEKLRGPKSALFRLENLLAGQGGRWSTNHEHAAGLRVGPQLLGDANRASQAAQYTQSLEQVELI